MRVCTLLFSSKIITGAALFLGSAFPFFLIAAESMSFESADHTNKFGSTLEEFFTAAIDYSPKLKIAESRLNVSSDRKRIAQGRLLPQLSAMHHFCHAQKQENGTSSCLF